MSTYEETLVAGWEDTYRKSQLSLWIMLALKDGAKHMAQIKSFIARLSGETISADDKSMYRALRRYHEAELIRFDKIPSSNGPELKVYELTTTGRSVLSQFIERNIVQIFYNEEVHTLITKG